MIKSELILRIAEQNPHLFQTDVEKLVGAVLDRIADALAAGDRVELRGFGAFTTRRRNSRTARNPRTGEPVQVDDKTFIGFRPGRDMVRRLNPTEPSGKLPKTRRDLRNAS